MKSAILLAAGKGTRMKSEKNKVMHPIIDRPILAYPLQAAKKAGAKNIVIIAGYQAQSLMDAFPEEQFALQLEQKGTGHAVMMASDLLENEEGLTLVINGDVPCIQPETLEMLYEKGKENSLTLLSAVLPAGLHYGRIVRDEDGNFLEIKEAKDCSEKEKEICEINAGVYCFNNQDLFSSLKELKSDNAQNEYYLTDLVKILRGKGKKVEAAVMDDPDEMAGINTVSELADVYEWMKKKNNEKWLAQGVQIVDPSRTVIGQDVQIGHDVIIHPGCEILGTSKIGDYSELLPNSWIKNAVIGNHVRTQFCTIDSAEIPDNQEVIMQVIREGTYSK